MSTLNIYILTYNRASLLKETLQSVLEQTIRDFSIFVLDNCSSDNTEDIVNSFSDTRIHYIRHQENIGGIENVNFAIEHCDADYFVMFHDDDIMLPLFVEKEMEILQGNESIAAVAGKSVLFGDTTKLNEMESEGYIFTEEDYFRNYMRYNYSFCFPAVMYRTSFLKKHQIRFRKEAGPSGDIVFISDIAMSGGVLCQISCATIKYRIHEGQDTTLNYYTNHLQLYRFLQNDFDYKNVYKEEKSGRKAQYKKFSYELYRDWMEGKRDLQETRLLLKGFCNALDVKRENICSLAFYTASRIKIIKTILRHYSKRRRHY